MLQNGFFNVSGPGKRFLRRQVYIFMYIDKYVHICVCVGGGCPPRTFVGSRGFLPLLRVVFTSLPPFWVSLLVAKHEATRGNRNPTGSQRGVSTLFVHIFMPMYPSRPLLPRISVRGSPLFLQYILDSKESLRGGGLSKRDVRKRSFVQ